MSLTCSNGGTTRNSLVWILYFGGTLKLYFALNLIWLISII